jgi:arabinofuranosyltransferase
MPFDVRRLVPAVGLAACAVHALRFAGPEFVLDDAWISFRVARNALEHGLLTYDVSAPVEGATNLLWTLVSMSWIGLAPGHDPIGVARVLGALAYAGAICVTSSTAAKMALRHRGNGVLAGLLAAVWMGAAGSMVFHAMAGLETGLWILLFAVSVRLWLEFRWAPAAKRAVEVRLGLGLGCALAALAATRPEGVLVAGFLATASLRAQQTRTVRILPMTIVASGMFLVAAFRVCSYGSIVPNTFHAKPPDPLEGLRYASAFLLWGIGLLSWIAVIPAWRRCADARWLLSCAALLAAGTVWSGGDWMPGYRRFALTFCVLGMVGAVGVALTRPGIRRRVTTAAYCSAIMASLLSAARGRDAAAYSPHGMTALASMVAETPHVQEVALVDVGRFGWHHPGSILDLAGLTDRHIAALPGGHLEKWDAEYFHQRAPELAFAFVETRDPNMSPFVSPMRMRSPVEDRMARELLSGERYRLHGSVQYAARLHVLVFARDDIALPVSTWGEPLPEPFRAAFAAMFSPGEP